MSSTNNGGPAFPRPAGDFNGTRHGNAAQTGMTLRDYFAAKAMQGFAADPQMGRETAEEIAELAYMWADAMLKQREQGAKQ